MEEKLLPPHEEEDEYPPFQRCGSIQTRNPTVVSFIESWLTMYRLTKNGSLNKRGYDHWIKEQLRALSNTPLPNFAPKPEEDE